MDSNMSTFIVNIIHEMQVLGLKHKSTITIDGPKKKNDRLKQQTKAIKWFKVDTFKCSPH